MNDQWRDNVELMVAYVFEFGLEHEACLAMFSPTLNCGQVKIRFDWFDNLNMFCFIL